MSPRSLLLSIVVAFAACVANGDGTGGTSGGSNDGKGDNGNSSTQLCYEHTCNGSSTGKRCFSDQAAYCSSAAIPAAPS